jgi:hypothetical protein
MEALPVTMLLVELRDRNVILVPQGIRSQQGVKVAAG